VGTPSGIKVNVQDPETRVILTREMNLDARFAFTSQIGGEHKICLQLNTSSWFGSKQKVNLHLDIETGVKATDWEQIAKQEELSEIEITVRRLNDRLKEVRSEQNYQRNREMVFRNTSESTNSRVMWWSIIQTLILLSTGLWQISHLRNFFKTKKLV